ncbi:MAG: rhomboid family intramembrane serine protease [Verrucomicrobiia bacterium]
MHARSSTAPETIPKPPPAQSLLPPAGTLALCLLTIGTAAAQSIGDGRQIAQAVGVDLHSLRSLSSLLIVADGQAIPAWLTLFTYVFPHGGWWHVILNVTALWVFGAIAERVLGSWCFVVGYLAFGAVGALCHVMIPPYSLHPVAGASLAIAGIVGAYSAVRWSRVSHSRRQRVLMIALEVAAIAGVLAWLAFRIIPAAPDVTCSVMYHFVPLLVMWFVVRAYAGCRRTTPRVHEPQHPI